MRLTTTSLEGCTAKGCSALSTCATDSSLMRRQRMRVFWEMTKPGSDTRGKNHYR